MGRHPFHQDGAATDERTNVSADARGPRSRDAGIGEVGAARGPRLTSSGTTVCVSAPVAGPCAHRSSVEVVAPSRALSLWNSSPARPLIAGAFWLAGDRADDQGSVVQERDLL